MESWTKGGDPVLHCWEVSDVAVPSEGVDHT
jgi:hypothetical protein